MNNKILKQTGLVALLALGGCAAQPGNQIVNNSGTAGELNQDYIGGVATKVAEKLCADKSFLDLNYKLETVGVPIVTKNADEPTSSSIEIPVITYDTKRCLEDQFEFAVDLHTDKVHTVKRLIDYNTDTGKLGSTIPTPGLWTRAGTNDQARYSLASKIAEEIPSDIVMASLLKMNQYGVDDRISANWYRDMKNDAVAVVVDSLLISAFNTSSYGTACKSLGSNASATSNIGDSTGIGSLGSSTSTGTVGVGGSVVAVAKLLAGTKCN
jgi:hypothetical protein